MVISGHCSALAKAADDVRAALVWVSRNVARITMAIEGLHKGRREWFEDLHGRRRGSFEGL